MTRRTMLLLSAAAACRADGSPEILVVRSARLPAHDEALEGLWTALRDAIVHCSVLDLDQRGSRGHLTAALNRKPGVIVTAGSSSVAAVIAAQPEAPIVAMMVLAPPAPRPVAVALTAITLEVPSPLILQRLRQLYPNRNRIAIVRGPALSAAAAAELEATSRGHGYQVKTFICPGPRELLHAIPAMQNTYDFAWCFPDSRLYQGAALSAAILAAIRYRIPIVGFSEGVVRAGALVGFYPDYREVGRQAGEAVLRRLKGEHNPSVERPRKVTAAINARVGRVLGILHAGVPAETVVVR